jgi:hypothetical protein
MQANVSILLTTTFELKGAKGVALADYRNGDCLYIESRIGNGVKIAAKVGSAIVRAKLNCIQQLGLTDYTSRRRRVATEIRAPVAHKRIPMKFPSSFQRTPRVAERIVRSGVSKQTRISEAGSFLRYCGVRSAAPPL